MMIRTWPAALSSALENARPSSAHDHRKLPSVDQFLVPWALVRWTTAGALRGAGFIVVHTPTKTNRLHVSVYPPETAEWDSAVAGTFNTCFTEE